MVRDEKNEKNTRVVALLTAAGTGSRMHMELPKQFLSVKDMPIIIYTMMRFERYPGVDDIIVATLPNWVEPLTQYAKQFGITKCRWVIPGGNTGQESITNCLEKLKEEGVEDDTVVMIHDGNRPLLPANVIASSIDTCMEKGNAVAYIPCNAVMLRTAEDQITCVEKLDRDLIKETQTPHTGRFGEVYSDYKTLKEKGLTNIVAYCDALMTLDKQLYLSEGSEINFKITRVPDYELFQAIVYSPVYTQLVQQDDLFHQDQTGPVLARKF